MLVDVGNSKLSWPGGNVPLVVELTTPSVNKLSVLLENYADVFVNGPNDPLGCTRDTEHSIDTGDSRPIKQRPYRIPVHLQTVVDQQVADMLERGLIRSSTSPWSSPIVLAPKKDGNYRFCVDFRRVNSVTKKDAQPMRNESMTFSISWAEQDALVHLILHLTIGRFRYERKTGRKQRSRFG